MKTFKLIILILICILLCKKYFKKKEFFSDDSNLDCSGKGKAKKKDPKSIFSPLTCGDFPVTKTDIFGGPLECGCKKLHTEIQLENKNIFIKHSGKRAKYKYYRNNKYRYWNREVRLDATRVGREHIWHYGYDKLWNGTRGYYRTYYPKNLRGKSRRHGYRHLLRWYLVEWDRKNRQWKIKNDFKHKLRVIQAYIRMYPKTLRETTNWCRYDKNCIGVRVYTHPKSKKEYYDYIIDNKNDPKKDLSNYLENHTDSNSFIKGLYVKDATKHKNVLTPKKCKKLIDIEKNDIFDHNGVIVRQNDETLEDIEKWYQSHIKVFVREANMGRLTSSDFERIKESYIKEKIEKIKNLINSKEACNEGLPYCGLSDSSCQWWARTNGYPYIDLARKKSCQLGEPNKGCTDKEKNLAKHGCSKDDLNVYYNKKTDTKNERKTKCSLTSNKFKETINGKNVSKLENSCNFKDKDKICCIDENCEDAKAWPYPERNENYNYIHNEMKKLKREKNIQFKKDCLSKFNTYDKVYDSFSAPKFELKDTFKIYDKNGNLKVNVYNCLKDHDRRQFFDKNFYNHFRKFERQTSYVSNELQNKMNKNFEDFQYFELVKKLYENDNVKKIIEENKNSDLPDSETVQGDCKTCRETMSVLEPLIYVSYKLFIELKSSLGKAVLKEVAGNLVKMYLGKVIRGPLLDEYVFPFVNNYQLSVCAKLGMKCPKKTSKGDIKKTILAAMIRTVKCMGIQTAELLAMSNEATSIKLLHRFARCFLYEISRTIIMISTSCTDTNSCKSGHQDWEEVYAPILNEIRETVVNKLGIDYETAQALIGTEDEHHMPPSERNYEDKGDAIGRIIDNTVAWGISEFAGKR